MPEDSHSVFAMFNTVSERLRKLENTRVEQFRAIDARLQEMDGTMMGIIQALEMIAAMLPEAGKDRQSDDEIMGEILSRAIRSKNPHAPG